MRKYTLILAVALSGCYGTIADDMDFSAIHATDDDGREVVVVGDPDDEEKDREDYPGYADDFKKWKENREKELK